MNARALAHLEALRLAELELVVPHLPPGGRVLELGAGSGWQARALAARGFRVEALDVPGGLHDATRVFPVRAYDGRRIPFAAQNFDVVFSSNVLEHVVHLEELLDETRRVLVPGGRAVHVLPTPAWRLWTSLLHWPHLARAALRCLARDGRAGGQPALPDAASAAPVRRSRFALLLPERHGEVGNAWSELARFSARAWEHAFARAGFRVVHGFASGLFYTGHALAGPRLALPLRRRLARALGSACRVYVLVSDPGD